MRRIALLDAVKTSKAMNLRKISLLLNYDASIEHVNFNNTYYDSDKYANVLTFTFDLSKFKN